jgi:hypothetical protein
MLDIEVFVSVVLAIVGLVLTVGWIIYQKVTDHGERISSIEERNETQTSEIISLKEGQQSIMRTVTEIETRRAEDVLQMTKAIGDLNVTLSGINITMKFNNEIMVEMREAFKKQQEDISKLKSR